MHTFVGDHFPVWGTCLGFEWLVDIFGGNGSIVAGFDAENLAAPLILTHEAATSRTYAMANASLIEQLETKNITFNAHSKGIGVAAAYANTKLMEVFHVLSISVDRSGKQFVAQIEGKLLPIFGNQFHPEKIEFVNSSAAASNIPRGPHAVAAARELAAVFVSEARKNRHPTAH